MENQDATTPPAESTEPAQTEQTQAEPTPAPEPTEPAQTEQPPAEPTPAPDTTPPAGFEPQQDLQPGQEPGITERPADLIDEAEAVPFADPSDGSADDDDDNAEDDNQDQS